MFVLLGDRVTYCHLDTVSGLITHEVPVFCSSFVVNMISIG